jgi:Pyruvate/2-oxoacid:ferredoxin oxidoreductase delta subunit
MNQQKTDWVLPLIDRQRCTGCGLCAQLCPTHAVEVHRALAVIVRPEACMFCDVCESYCPEGAIGRPFTIVFGPDASRKDPNSTGMTQEEHIT